MTIANSTLKPGKPLVRKSGLRQRTPMPRFRANKRQGGAAHKTALALDLYRPTGHKEPTVLRSLEHRQNVANLPCVKCGIAGFSQAAHPNFDKGLSLKVCDSLTFPLCCDRPGVRGCHSHHDQGGMPRAERWGLEWHYADSTRAELLRFNLWPRSVEAYYQKAIVALRRVAE